MEIFQTLMTVDEALQVSGRGCLLFPMLRNPEGSNLRVGAAVELLRPDGSIFISVIHGLEAVHNRREDAPEIQFLIALPRTVNKSDAPKGTLVRVLLQNGIDGPVGGVDG